MGRGKTLGLRLGCLGGGCWLWLLLWLQSKDLLLVIFLAVPRLFIACLLPMGLRDARKSRRAELDSVEVDISSERCD